MHKFLSLPSKFARNKRNERGLSLVELLVAMIIFAVIAAATVSIIVMLNNSTAKFQTTTTTQNELNIAMNTIQRDISQAQSVSTAGKYYIGLNSVQKDISYKTFVFYYDGTSDNVPDGADKSNLPRSTQNRGTIIEQTLNGTTLQSQKVLVANYAPSSSWNSFFQYYTQNGTQLGSSAASLSADQLSTVSRVQFSLQSKVSDRTTPVELASAATVNSYQAGVNCTDCDPVIPAAPILRGNITYESTSFDGNKTANLTWNQPGGTDSYTIYRQHGNDKIVVTTILAPETTHYEDSNGLVYGETYIYTIVANGPSGLSSESNPISLTVRPPKTMIVNINTTANLTQVKGDGNAENGTTNPAGNLKYTVARDLTNQITWAPSNGATGYRLYRDGMSLSILSGNGSTTYQDSYNQDTNPSITYGATHTYYVVPFNVGQNSSGGDGVKTENVQLIGPPTSPVIDTNEYTGITGNPYNTIRIVQVGVAGPDGNTVTGNHLYGSNSATAGQTVNRGSFCATNTFNAINTPYFAPSGSITHGVGFGTATCYAVTAYNDAGESPRSNSSLDHVHPGDFSVVNKNTTAGLDDFSNGYRYTVARGLTNQVVWTPSAGAGGYEVYRNGQYVGYQSGNGNTTFRDNNRNYGDVTTYTIRADTNWVNDTVYYTPTSVNNAGDQYKATLVSPPVAPTISGSEYGSTTGNPYNTLTLTNGVPNASGYQLQRNTSTTNIGDCNNLSYTGQDFGNQGDQRNDNVDWGSSTCYKALSYNDAGFGQYSNGVILYVGPADFSIQNITTDRNQWDSTNNGMYYTTARDTTDQIAWNTAAGADGYDNYRNGNYAYNVGNSTRTRDNRNYGDQTNYHIRAYSNWSGSNRTIYRDSLNDVNLDSAPNAPTVYANAVDQSSGNSSTSYNTVGISKSGAGSPTYNYYYYGDDNTTATTGCSNVHGIGSSNGGTVNDTVNWGTSSCYFVQGENNAGRSPSSNTDTSANQRPSALDWDDSSGTTGNYYRYLNIYSTLSSTTTCYGDRGNVDYCYYVGTSDPARYQYNHEQFNSDNQVVTDNGVKYYDVSSSLQYRINWTEASGRGEGSRGYWYKLSYNTGTCGDTLASPSTQTYGSGDGSSRVETLLTPACYYTANVTAYANNNLTRDISKNFITSPDVPRTGDNYIMRTNNANWGRRLQTGTLNTGVGSKSLGTQKIVNSTEWTTGSQKNSGADEESQDITPGNTWNSWTVAAVPDGDGLKSLSTSQTKLTSDTGTLYASLKLNFQGSIGQGNCPNTCQGNWGTQQSPSSAAKLAESSYTDKYHPRYKSRD